MAAERTWEEAVSGCEQEHPERPVRGPGWLCPRPCPRPACPPPAATREDFRVCFMAATKSKCAISLPGKQNIKNELNISAFHFHLLWGQWE